MNLLSSHLRRTMPDKKELSIVTFSSETVVFDGKETELLPVLRNRKLSNISVGQEIPVDRQGSEYYE